VLVASVASALGNAPKTPGSCLVSMSDLPLDEDTVTTSTTVTNSDGASSATTVPGSAATTVAPSSPPGQ
jgi:hypothetical protein